MNRFIQRFADKITGVLSGFDRLVLRGTLRPIAYARGMMGFLWHKQILLKDFARYVENTTLQLREASCQAALASKRPVVYLRSCKTDKQALAQEIAAKDKIDQGLVVVISCVEPCMSYGVSPNRQTGKVHLELLPRKCIFLYHYLIDAEFGFMNARIQTWFPFSIQICLNGREWLARQMDRAGLSYDRLDNCFPWIENFAKAQKLMNRQLRTAWATKLDRFARMLNPIHNNILEGFPIRYYWSAFENEWATDIAFKSADALGAIYPALVLHGMTTFSSNDVMRFLGRKIRGDFQGEVVTDFKCRPEGVRIKHRAGKNSLKLYDKFAMVLRTEFTMNDPSDFKIFRPKENDPGGKCRWRPLRHGVADIHRRAQVSQVANERYLDALAATDTSVQLGDLVRGVCSPTSWCGKRVRALRPWSQDDIELLRAVSNGKFSINGFRNRDLQDLLFKTAVASLKEKRRRSGRVSRLLRMLRAHHLIQRVPSTYRYVLSPKGSQIITAILSAQRITLEQLNRLAA
jgi:hypothetical protein